mgnify:CR=1 FL=1
MYATGVLSPLSLLGRAALYKMMSLPRFVYALQNDPFQVPDSYFAAIEGEIRRLLWEGSDPRIALRKLTLSWFDRGIALPDIRLYYWATQLININRWSFLPQEEPALRMDRYNMQPRGFYVRYMVHKMRPFAKAPL